MVGDTTDIRRFHRTSPPGSPTPKKCYEHRDSQQIFCCCYSSSTLRGTSVLATFGICLLVLLYTIFGAFVFMTLEGGMHVETEVAASSHIQKKSPEEILRSQTVDKLWSITENLNILYKDNWTKLAAEELSDFQNALINTKASVSFQSVQIVGNDSARWSFSSSFLYSVTLITTIGYGSVSPQTISGKVVTVIYALIGIPLMLLYLSAIGDLLARAFRKLYTALCSVRRKQPCSCTKQPVRVPVLVCIIILLVYIAVGAILFHYLEHWTLLQGSYFCFTSLGTIGFGDLVPGQGTTTGEMSLCACSIYILLGMALIAMCFSLLQDQVVGLFRIMGTSCTSSKELDSMKVKEEVQMAVVGS